MTFHPDCIFTIKWHKIYDSYVAFSAVAHEFGVSQADTAVSASQQPPQATSTVHILSLLLRLRQCCCHLSLLQKVLTELCNQILVAGGVKQSLVLKSLTLFFLFRLLTHRSFRGTESSCHWRSNSVPCLSPPAPRPQARTPKPLCHSTALASPHICLRTPV